MKLYSSILTGYQSRADRSLKITFHTAEATPDDAAFAQEMLNKAVFLAINDNPFKTEELKEIENLKTDFNDTGKTASQRLRNVLWILFQQQPDGFTEFQDFYNSRMEKLINQIKDRLI